MRIAIVHGARLTENGSLSLSFKNRLDETIRIINHDGNIDKVLICGGQTRPGQPPEAVVGKEYLKEKTNVPILTEERSRTTAENIVFSRDRITENVDEAIIITGNRSILRIKYLYKRLWPEIKNLDFVGVTDQPSIKSDIYEFLFLIFAILNPKEKYLEFFKSKYRGGKIN